MFGTVMLVILLIPVVAVVVSMVALLVGWVWSIIARHGKRGLHL